MFCGYIKGLIIKINNPKRYFYLETIRGNYRLLNSNRKKLLNKFKLLLQEQNISYYLVMSRIKTIGSVDRKERYNKTQNTKNNHYDSIGVRIVTYSKKDCYKVMNLLLKNFRLEKEKNIINPEDFFKNKKLMRNTTSISKNQIFMKINYNSCSVHFILILKYNLKFISKERQKYINYINNIINKT